jgi:hypothetical protein
MPMITYKRGPISIAEHYLDDPVVANGASVARYLHRETPPSAGRYRRSSTLVISLTRSDGELFGLLNSTTRYEIRRANAEGVTVVCTRQPTADSQRSYADYYDSFALARQLRRLNRHRFSKFAESGSLLLTEAMSKEGARRAIHIYILGRRYARLLHSASLISTSLKEVDRNAVARANRNLHWRDILELRDEGFERLDFGGWYEGNEDTTLLGINRFKQGFGGTQMYTYSWDIGQSFAGKILLYALSVRGRHRVGR